MSFKFEIINENEIKIIKYFGNEAELIIPSHHFIEGKIYKITVIDKFSLNNSFIKKLYIPSSINYISENAFVGFNELNLEEIIVDDDNMFYASLNGSLLNKEKTILIKYPPKSLKKRINIINGIKVIEQSCFENAINLKTINLPNTLEEIKAYAFASCSSLKNIKLPSSLISIGDYAFFNYEVLDKIKLPSSLICIGEGVFYSLKKPYINISVASKNKAFKIYKGGLFSFDKKILYKYFEVEDKVKLPSSLKEIKAYAFSYSFINYISLPEKLSNIEKYAFIGSSIKKINTPINIKVINNSTFAFCNELIEARLNNVNDIELSAFFSCSKLKDVYIPNNINKIDDSAFNLTNIDNFLKVTNKEF